VGEFGRGRKGGFRPAKRKGEPPKRHVLAVKVAGPLLRPGKVSAVGVKGEQTGGDFRSGRKKKDPSSGEAQARRKPRF